jgi:hypothetical protein
MPVMGSNRDLKWAMVHAGETRRSEDALAEVMRRGISTALDADAIAQGGVPRLLEIMAERREQHQS